MASNWRRKEAEDTPQQQLPTPTTPTVLGKENLEEAHERKKNLYETLCTDCVEKGWICPMIPIEIGCRGFLRHSVISFFFKNRNPWLQF